LASRAPRRAAGHTTVSPSEASLVPIRPRQIAAAVCALDGVIKQVRARTGVPGIAAAVVHDDKLVYARGFGVRSVKTRRPVQPATVFQLASVSKSLASTVVARAVGEGIVSWTDPVVRFFPAFALADPYVTAHVTFADLFSHHSGLPGEAGDLLEALGYGRAYILGRLRYEPLAPFRASYAYTNFGLTAAGQAAANAAHTSWQQLSERLLYRPLGMRHTSSRHSDFVRAANRAALHFRVDGRWRARYTRNADAQSPAGGASSTVLDLARWLRLQLANGKWGGRQLIDKQALLETHLPRVISAPLATPNSRASFYGLGMNVGYDYAGRLRVSHSGAFVAGAATAYTLLPSANLGIVVLTNGMPIGVPEAIIATFLDLAEAGSVQEDWLALLAPVFASLYRNPSRLAGKRPPLRPTPARPDAFYVGAYVNDFYGPARVVARDGGLHLRLGPKPSDFLLRHWNGDTFSYKPVQPGPDISAVIFAAGAGGTAAAVTVEDLDDTGLGTFTRARS
jgi:CubicO group peptidase (beta-lactamase class C family)